MSTHNKAEIPGKEGGVDLDEVAEELYALRPQAFTAARNEQAQRARADGHRELAEQIRALHRPTLAAWASNLLVREQRETVAPLLQLGTELRNAHRNLDGEELRALSRQQHELVSALTRQGGQLASDAGAPLGPQAQQELTQTLQAVLADPDAAEEWAAGRLSKPLIAPVGFDAAAREAAAAPARRKSSAAGVKKSVHADRGKGAGSGEARARQQNREAAERAKAETRQAADQARRMRQEAEAARRDAQAARAARLDADERHGQLRGELREAEKVLAGARKDEREAERVEREARKAAEKAEERAQRLADGS